MVRCGLAATLALALSLSAAHAGDPGFKVAFSNCTEFAGEGFVPLPPAQKLVPPEYLITAASPGQAPIVVRITQCEAVQVDRAPAVPTIISQIGINIVSPDGTGTINNYMLIYVTNNRFLAEAFERIGVPASYDPTITSEYTRDTTGNGGVLYGAVPNAGIPAYFLYGPETEPPPNTQQLFIANWWHGTSIRVRQQTTFPAISFGTSSVTLYTSAVSPLGQLIGGNAYDRFSVLALRGEYASAEMVVSSARR
jgi:hypothetical protein